MTITIPANGVSVLTAFGPIFTCLSCTATFKLTIGNQEERTVSAGQSIGSKDGAPVRHLVFRDTSGSNCTVEFEVGNEPIQVNQQIAAGTITSISNLANDIANCVAATPLQFAKPSSTPGTPVALTATQTFFRRATILAKKSLAGAANTGDVRIGPSATASQQPYVLAAGDEIVLEAPLGAKWNFQSWYLDVDNSGDGVVIIYT